MSMSEELNLLLSCAPTILSILTEPPKLLNYLVDKQRKRGSEELIFAIVNSEDEEDDADQELNHVNKKPKLLHGDDSIENEFPALDFEIHFKMSKSTVQKIIEVVERTNIKPVQRGRPIMPLKKMVVLSLWLLTNQEGFRSVSVRFGIGKGHAHRAFKIFCETLHSISHEYICWPDTDEANFIMEGFAEKSNLPLVMGAIGIIHVAIPKPGEHDELFHNKFGCHSVILQGICNHRHEFINVLAGPPGGSSENQVWTSSPLYEKLMEGPIEVLYDNSYLVGSNAYPLTDYVMPPYHPRSWRSEQEAFNRAHKTAHDCIKTVFKMLLSRFQRLIFLNMTRLELIPKVIVAACVLHNLCMQQDERDFTILDHGVDEYFEIDFPKSEENGTTKRDEVANSLITNTNL